jgi:hypothetical protein
MLHDEHVYPNCHILSTKRSTQKPIRLLLILLIFEIIKTKGFSNLELLSKTKIGNFLFQIFTLEK